MHTITPNKQQFSQVYVHMLTTNCMLNRAENICSDCQLFQNEVEN